MALPFQNPVSQVMPGFGSPSYYGAATQTPTATGTVTITIANTATTPSTGGTAFNPNGGPAPVRGMWHFRIVNATTTATVTLEVRITDGTNTWVLRPPNSAYTIATGYLDYMGEFNTDVSITQIIFIVVVGGTVTSCPIDCEVAFTN